LPAARGQGEANGASEVRDFGFRTPTLGVKSLARDQ